MVTCTLSPGFGGLSAGNAVSGRTPSVLNPISRTTESGVKAITVPSRLGVPGSLLRGWLCSYWKKRSLKDSVGSLAVVDSGAPGVDGAEIFGSDAPGSEVLGLDVFESVIKRLQRPQLEPALG